MSPTRRYKQLVLEFHTIFQVAKYNDFTKVPKHVKELRCNLITEEHKEYQEATTATDKLDALCDLIYVVVGTAITCNISVYDYETTKKKDKYSNPSTMALSSVIPMLTHELSMPLPCPVRVRNNLNNALHKIEDVAALFGFRIHEAFEAVHRNNMLKLWSQKPTGVIYKDNATPVEYTCRITPKGWLVTREDGKVLKPVDHRKVDLTSYV